VTLTEAEFVRLVDQTLLKAESTEADVVAIADEGRRLGTASVCVNGSWVSTVASVLAGTDTVPCAVVGFPLGAMVGKAKAVEAAFAVEHGAAEVDMMLNVGLLRSGRLVDAEADITAVRRAIDPSTCLMVILETAVLTDDEIREACQIAEWAEADFVKTSTGFHAAGGASVAAVALMRETVGDRLGVKASGGVRTLADVTAMVDAGASRLGLSGTAGIIEELRQANPSNS
jgi:deoxyribose-phosphate aldolase